MDAEVRHIVPTLPLTAEAFAPYGDVIVPKRQGGQFVRGTGIQEEPQLTIMNGEPVLRIMHLAHRGLVFTKIARHRRVTQCLGALQGKDWFLGVAPPDLTRAEPRLEDIVGFHIPGDRIVKLHRGTWHAGPHFVHEEAMFLNLENRDTNSDDFEDAVLPFPCEMRA